MSNKFSCRSFFKCVEGGYMPSLFLMDKVMLQFKHYLFNMIFVSNLRGVGISVLLNVLNIVKTVPVLEAVLS